MLGIIWHQNGADYEIKDGQLAVDDGLSTMVFLLLCTDARATESDELPTGITDMRGWPGNTFAEFNWGSRLWLLRREKLTSKVKNRAIDFAKEALQPLIKQGHAKRISVTGVIPRRSWLRLDIHITRPDGTELSYGLSQRWEAQAHAV